MKRKKILWLCSWYPNKVQPFDGDFIQRHARAEALYNDIYVIRVVNDDEGKITQSVLREVKREEGLTEIIVYYKKKNNFIGRYIAAFRWFSFFKKEVKNYISQNGKPQLVHVHVPIKAGGIAIWMKKKFKTKYIVTEHWGIYNDVDEKPFEKRTPFFKKFTKEIFDDASAFLTVSKYLGDGVNKLVTSKPFILLPNVADTSLFYFTEKQNPVFRFIHVSNMVPLKNVQGILQAAAQLKASGVSFQLILIGNQNNHYPDLAKQMNIDDVVIFKDEIPYIQVAQEMQQANALVHFSNIENAPCVISEALCSGLPVIATAVGGVPEMVNEQNGILIAAGDVNALANAMKQMMNSYQQFDCKKIAANAQNIYSYNVVGNMLNDIYQSNL